MYKMTKREREIAYFRIFEPYGFDIKDGIAYPFNRNYSKLGKEQEFNRINSTETIYLYGDESNPYSVIELLKGSVYSILISSIIGLIMAAFFKSKSQE